MHFGVLHGKRFGKRSHDKDIIHFESEAHIVFASEIHVGFIQDNNTRE